MKLANRLIPVLNSKARDINAGLVAYYKFNGNGNDEINALNASLFNVTYAPSQSGQAVKFSGANNCYGSISHSQLFDFNDFSISLWIKPSVSDLGTGIKGLVDKAPTTTATVVRPFWVALSNGKISFSMGNGSINEILLSNLDIVADVWVNVNCVASGSTAAIYINGSLDNTKSLAISRATNSNDINLGRLTSASTSDRYYSGEIDNLRMYNRALQVNEVVSIYQNKL